MSRKPKILAIIQLSPPVHGAAVMNGLLVNGGLWEKFDFDVVRLNFSVSLEDIGSVSLRAAWAFFWLFAKVLRQLIFHRPDLVYLTPSQFGGAIERDCLLCLLVRFFRRDYVLHLHGRGIRETYEKSNFVSRRLIYAAFGGAKRVVCLSRLLVGDIEQFAIRDQIEFVANGIPDLAEEIEREIKGAIESPTVLFLSNMVRTKGPLVVLEAAPKVLREFPGTRFVFAGEWFNDNCKADFYDLIEKYGLQDNVAYVGPVYGKRKIRLLELADVFVFPSFFESMPLVVQEAMQFSLPIVATRYGAIPDEIEDGISGYLVKPEDPLELSYRILDILRDPVRARNMGEAARERYETYFSVDIWEKRMARMLSGAISANVPSRLDS